MGIMKWNQTVSPGRALGLTPQANRKMACGVINKRRYFPLGDVLEIQGGIFWLSWYIGGWGGDG